MTALASEVRLLGTSTSETVPQGLKSLRENSISKLSPAGTVELSPGR